MYRFSSVLVAIAVQSCTCSAFAGAFNFQEPGDWLVGDAASTFQRWTTPFQTGNTLPTAYDVNPSISTDPGMSVETPGFVAGSGGYYSPSGPYHISATIYNHGGSVGTASYASGYGTRVLIQTAATTNPDSQSSTFVDSIEITEFDGTPIAGGANADLIGVTELFRQEVQTDFGLAEQLELLFEFYLPAYSADFRVRFQQAMHSSFQEMRIDTLLVEESTFPGDFDGDGDIDAADLADWQTSYGVDGAADADGDGDTDGRDFLVWQRNYTGSPALAAFAVPEPTSLLVVIFGIIAGLHYRTRVMEKSR